MITASRSVDLLGELQADRAGALRDVWTLERMHHGAAFRVDDRVDHAERVVDRRRRRRSPRHSRAPSRPGPGWRS